MGSPRAGDLSYAWGDFKWAENEGWQRAGP